MANPLTDRIAPGDTSHKAQGAKQVSCAVPTLLIVKERYGMASAVQRRAVWVVIGFGLFAVDDKRLPRVFIFVNT
ncbi:TPA: hypothetical protein MC588_003321 [Citrobacter amalonaticus]|uniref:hypothetical protein n=1 Tax=Citrobacter amalonaticus TaxID=35703 RepID=UPI0013002995|nr:hypothetical protein [Citrobacter amalonaticus]HBU6573844.1 hypothetical protein [Citrobacter amalonaticus]